MLSLDNLFKYLSAGASSRCIVEGQQYLKNKLYRMFGYTRWDGREMHMYSHAAQISDISEPHTVKGVVFLNEESTEVAEIGSFTCSCKAGLGERCKHISAVLLLMNRTDIDDLQQLSVTDINCSWVKKDIKKVFQPTPHGEFCCVPKWNRLKLFSTKDQQDAFHRTILNDFSDLEPHSAYAKHRSGRKEVLSVDTEAGSKEPISKKPRRQLFGDTSNSTVTYPPARGPVKEIPASVADKENNEASSSDNTMPFVLIDMTNGSPKAENTAINFVTSTPLPLKNRNKVEINQTTTKVRASKVQDSVSDSSSSLKLSINVENISNPNITCPHSCNLHCATVLHDKIMQNELFNDFPMPKIEELSPCCAMLYSSLSVDRLQAINLCMIEQGSEKWHEFKKYKISGSTCYSFYTYGIKGKNWKDKSLSLVNKKKFTHPNLQHGIDNEPKAQRKYIEETGYKVINFGLIVHLAHPWLVFSPDGVVFYDGVPQKLIEIKCPVLGNDFPICDALLDQCDFLVKKHESKGWELKKRHKYFGQVQMGMALLDVQSCDLVIYAPFDDSLLIVTVKRDNPFIASMLQTLKTNYFKTILPYMCHLVS